MWRVELERREKWSKNDVEVIVQGPVLQVLRVEPGDLTGDGSAIGLNRAAPVNRGCNQVAKPKNK